MQPLSNQPKILPTMPLLIDDQGSELFEQICELLEYYPTRTEQAILETSEFCFDKLGSSSIK
ncbi:L-histidine N(alpha)-methyltransferase [Nostoc sp. CALU 1950]|uniref:L-histidine N(alpha)-methyltransferase n=1 Tax=Nostoc sp. CALU 1950 TaxID=3104321 RepID=UPI003EBCCEA8